MKNRVAMIGYFGWGNFGDELFLKVHRQRLESKFELFVGNDLTAEPYFSRSVSDLVVESDAFLIGGGDLLNPMRVSALYWQMDFLEKPVFVYGLGVPNQPFRRENVMEHYRQFMAHENCRLVVARDVESYTWIKENLDPGEKLQWFPDPVCAMNRPEPLPMEQLTLGVVMREHRSLSADMTPVRKMIDHAKVLGYRVKHIVLANKQLGKGDFERAELIAQEGEEIFVSEDLDEMCREISACSLLATIKFHGLVVATMYGVPAIAMSVTPKNRNFLRMIERPEMLASYTDSGLKDRLSRYPARIHQRVRADLYNRAVAGYQLLERELDLTFAG